MEILRKLISFAGAEVVLVGAFFLAHLIVGPNRYYMLSLFLLFVFLYEVSGSFLEAIWFLVLGTLPFYRGRFFEGLVFTQLSQGRVEEVFFQGGIFFSDIMLGILVYFLVTRYKRFRKKISSKSLLLVSILLIFFVVNSLASSYFSEFVFASWYSVIQLIKFSLLFFVAKIALSDLKVARKSLQILLLFVFLNSSLVILQFLNNGPLGILVEEAARPFGAFATENPDLYRPGGITADPNIAATFVAVLLPPLVALTLSLKEERAYLGWTATGVYLLALIMTASRTAWFVSTVSALTALFVVKRQRKVHIPIFIKKYWYLLLLPPLIALGPVLIERILTLNGIFLPEGGGTYRIDHIKAGWQILRENKTGVGVGAFPFVLAKYFPPDVSGLNPTLAHNVFAQVGAETGFVGLILFAAFLYFLLRDKLGRVIKETNPLGLAMLISFATMSILMLAFPWFLHPRISWLFWLTSAYPVTNYNNGN